jgi:two-component system, sensor histidine kinase
MRPAIGGIDAMTDMLLALAMTPEQRRLIAGLKAAALHLRSLSSHIIEGGDDLEALYDIHPIRLALDIFLDPLLASANARASAKRVRFALECDVAEATEIEIDPSRTRQMLENLIDNAFKVVDTGEVILRISSQHDALRFAVLDTGPGFKPSEIDRLFERRMQTSRGPKGAGIGLSLVKRYAEAAGGACGAHNRALGGAEIWFSLPQNMLSESAQPQRRQALVVEDSYAGRLLMRTMLEHFGFSVTLAPGGAGALEAIARQHFDLITIDKMLGDADGAELTRRLRDRLDKESATRIIAVTGRTDDTDRAHFSLAGAEAFLPKPLSPRAMAEVLTRLGFALGGSSTKAA